MRIRLQGIEYAPMDFVPGRVVREALEITRAIDFKDMQVEDMDRLVNFVARVYGEQFSRDDFYDGIALDEMLPAILDCITSVTERFSKGASSKNELPA